MLPRRPFGPTLLEDGQVPVPARTAAPTPRAENPLLPAAHLVDDAEAGLVVLDAHVEPSPEPVEDVPRPYCVPCP